MIWLEGIAGFTALLGYFLISENILIWGFSISIIGEVLWAYWGHLAKAYFFIFMSLAFLVASINGLVNTCLLS